MRITPIVAALAAVLAGACSSSPDPAPPAAGVVQTTATTAPGMTFAECQKSAEYPGGRYPVSFDNGVCTVQKPADAPAVVSYASCDEVRAAGKAPLHLGDPGYSSKLDRDGDGTACDA